MQMQKWVWLLMSLLMEVGMGVGRLQRLGDPRLSRASGTFSYALTLSYLEMELWKQDSGGAHF